MKTARILLAAFVLFPINLHAQNGAQNIDPEAMHRCQSFSECTLVWDGCADAAVNKKYANLIMQTSVCKKSIAHNPSALPTCTDGMCVIVVRDKKK